MDYQEVEKLILLIAMTILSITMLLCLYYAIKGPRFTDRLLAASAISTKAIMILIILTVYFGKGYLADIALVFGAIGFTAMIIIGRVYVRGYEADKSSVQYATPKKIKKPKNKKAVKNNHGSN